MTSTTKPLLLIVLGLASLLYANSEMIPRDSKFTSPSADKSNFKKYADYTMILDEDTSDRNRRNAIVFSGSRWPDAIVPFAISDEFSSEEKNVIIQAMKHWENCTCVRFRERTNTDNYYVMIMSGRNGECRSFIGRIHISFQPQGLVLGPGCVHFSVVVHEIGHALGFFHEQSRADRDSYVRILSSSIIPGFESQFEKVPESQATTLGIGYDYASIMHYATNTFAMPNTETIQPLDRNIPVGSAEELSPLDAAKANLLYECSTIPPRQSVLPPLPSTAVTLPSGVSCGNVINIKENGAFQSNNYPTHLLNQDCAYVFVAPKGYSVSVQFTPLLLDPTTDCSADYVQIYDGSSTSSNNLYRYFGYTEGRICNRDDSRYIFHTSSNILTVYHHTDGQKTLSDSSGLRVAYSIFDIDECLNSRCHQCTNTPGSFKCSCNSGYYYSAAATTCYDVNECAINNGGCEDNCDNFGGGYRCTCNSGRFLQTDGKTCSSIPPAVSPTNLPPGTILPKNQNSSSSTTALSTTIPVIPTTMTTNSPPPTTTLPSTTTPLPTTSAPPTNPAPQQLSQCGGGLKTLTTSTGSIQTLGYPNTAYPVNTNCEWDIQCPDNNVIDISFANIFRVAGRMPTCPRSQLILSGCGDTYGPYCHLTAPSPITTSCNAVKVTFTAGSRVGQSRTGFQLYYTCKLKA